MKLCIFLVMCLYFQGCTTGPGQQEESKASQPLQETLNGSKVPGECQPFLNAIQEGDQDLQLKLLKACSESGEEGVLAFLLELIQNKELDGLLKMDIIMQLGEMGQPEAAPPLIDLLKLDMTERKGFAGMIIPVLGQLGERSAVPVLLEALNKRDDSWLFSGLAAQSLGQLGDLTAIEPLIRACSWADTRAYAIQALAMIGDVRCIPVLLDAVDPEEDLEIRESAEKGLIRIGEPGVTAISDVVLNVSREYPQISRKKLLIHLLGQMGTHQAKTALLKITELEAEPITAQEAKLVLSQVE